MANAAATLFSQYLDAKELKNEILGDDGSVVRTGWKLDNTTITMLFFFDEECQHIQLVGRDFVTIPGDKAANVLKVCNTCNKNYRWVKFYVDEERNEVIADCDAVIQLDTCAEEAFELMVRMSQIVDSAFPEFMKAMWS